MTRDSYFHQLADLLGVPHTNQNAYAWISWAQAEGGNAKFNPLNTTLDTGVPGTTDYNSVGVKNYPTVDAGLKATAQTLKQQNFANILEHLRASSAPKLTLRAVEHSQWGTGGLALRVLPFVKANYSLYANHTIAGS